MHEELDTVIVEFDADRYVGHLTLNRPDRLNTLSPGLSRDIVAGLELLEEQNEDADGVALRAVVIEGAGDRAFCAGADVTSFGDRSPAADSDRGHYQFIMDFPVPVIAKIHGYCLGGGLETAMSCDFRLATEDAELGLPEVDLGIIPGAGGVQFVSKMANPAIAKEIAMRGQTGFVSGTEAASHGLVNSAHPADELDDAVAGLADRIASQPPLAIQAIKRSANMAVQSNLREGLEYDSRQFAPLLSTEDAEEGMRAFAEDDYEPEFKGR